MTLALLVAMALHGSMAALPQPSEMDEAARWVAAEFVGQPAAEAARARIEVVTNNDAVQANARGGKPLNLGGKIYTRGLYCHAESRLVVHLPSAGKTFDALAGVDSNDQTSGGRGSVAFSVGVNGGEVWHSEILRENSPAVPVQVALNGALSFELAAGTGGDGMSCDQADWADARVVLENGSSLWLGDLPLEAVSKEPYSTRPFFSFEYGGKSSNTFLAQWPVTRESSVLDPQRTRHTITYRDPETGLEIRCQGVAYQDFPTVEWTLHFKNTGGKDSPILSNIQAIDTVFERAAAEEFRLRYNKGDDCTADSYEPKEEVLAPNVDKRIANSGGRPTQIAFPYFNIGAGNEGLIAAVSWAGQWSAQLTRGASNELRLRAGQELTHFKLLPAEEVRSPMVVLQFWQGDATHAQNVWRAWMVAHNTPRPGGQLPPAPQMAACSSHQFAEMINANTESQKFFITNYLDRGMKLDYWWMDAGWYWNKTGWPNTGTWEVDTNRFPGGLRPISDYAHEKGVNIIVWFEPERVTSGTWLTDNHPEWIFGGAKGGLFNLGNPEAHAWLVEHVDRLLTEQGIDLYRQDFNIDPLPFWRANDSEDRQGITEIRYVEGYFSYWDALRERHPNMLIDSCASGGRRNDLETLRRAVPLLRSDYIMEPIGNQCHTYALASWFPYYGTGTSKTDPYLIRSTLCPSFTACWDQREPGLDWTGIAKLVAQWKAFAPNYYGDYYPLTGYSLRADQWIGWQFDRPEVGGGLVQVFRRESSIYEVAKLPLRALVQDAQYRVENIDAPDQAVTLSGKVLCETGLPVSIQEKPGTAFFVYKRQ